MCVRLGILRPRMQFLVTAYDGDDPGALERRLAARAAHIARSDELIAIGRALYGAALLDEDGRMIGSAMVMEFPDRAALDAWLASEPYVEHGVWRSVDVRPCRVGPSFAGLSARGT